MIPETFFEKFDQLSDAPGSVTKMRELVLELAVHGKLVSQEHGEEPASLQLSRIASAKNNRGRVSRGYAGRTTAPKATDSSTPVPQGWAAVPLEDLVTILNGRAYAKHELLDSGTPVLRVGNLFTSRDWYYSDLELEPDKYCDGGDLIFAWSASFGPFVWKGPKVIFHYHIWKLELHSQGDLSKDYLYLFLQSKTQEIKRAGHGVSMLHMTKEKMEQLEVLLPPFAEQVRIVEKVGELMALCDRLESQQKERETRHAALARAAIARFDEAPTPANLSFLFHPSYSVTPADLRKAILNLAIRGKLLPQDPSDETVADLTRRIDQVRSAVRARVYPAIESSEAPFEIPISWSWVRLGNIALHSDSGWSPQCDPQAREGDAWGVLKVSAVSWGVFLPQENKALPPDLRAREECEVKAGDFLVSRANTEDLVARSVVVIDTPPHLMMSDKIVRFAFPDLIDKGFINLVNSASFAREYYSRNASGTSSSMKNVGRDVMSNLPVPLPPLEEQRRIVAKTDALFELLNDMEELITSSRSMANDLADAIVGELVKAGGK